MLPFPCSGRVVATGPKTKDGHPVECSSCGERWNSVLPGEGSDRFDTEEKQ